MNGKIKIAVLSPDGFPLLKEIFESEFDSDLPAPEHSCIAMAIAEDTNEPVGFILMEQVVMVGQVYIFPQARQTCGRMAARKLINFVQRLLRGKHNTCAVASEPRFARLFNNLGMHEVEGTLFRLNLPYKPSEHNGTIWNTMGGSAANGNGKK
jgi:hypothetical protein